MQPANTSWLVMWPSKTSCDPGCWVNVMQLCCVPDCVDPHTCYNINWLLQQMAWGLLFSHCHYGFCGFISVISLQSPLQSTEYFYWWQSSVYVCCFCGRNEKIHYHCSSLYYPAANGAVKRSNRVLKHTVQTAIQQHKLWKPVVTDFLQVYCATLYAATGTSSFQLLHGRQMRTRLFCYLLLCTRQLT